MAHQFAANGPLTALDTILPIGLDVHRADCKIVEGSAPSACPNADPPLPADYLPLVVEVFKRHNGLPDGYTIHWVGHKAWRRNICDCAFPNGAGCRAADGRRGRKRHYDRKKDREVAEAWKLAKGHGVTQKDFVTDWNAEKQNRQISLKSLNRILDRVRKSRN